MKKNIARIVSIMVATVFASALTAQGGIQANHNDWFGGWADIGQPGNAGETYTDQSDNEHTHGGVGYEYQIAKHAVSIADWEEMVVDTGSDPSGNYDAWDDGTKGERGTDMPAVSVSMYQASGYANWLTTGDPQTGLYDPNSDYSGWDSNPAARDSTSCQDLIDTHGTVYALPTEDEWYKAAYYSLDESSVGDEVYYDFAHGSDTPPAKGDSADDEWSYDRAITHARDVGRYGLEQNDTRNMMGNVWEWQEDPGGLIKGGDYYWSPAEHLRSSMRNTNPSPTKENSQVGFRVVAIPEPSSLLLLGLAGLLLMKRRRV